MERLTSKKEADAQRREYEKHLKNGYPRNIPEERFLKLAAYEDAMPLERAQAIAQAEKDGRLVVLPCKVRDTVYQVDYMKHSEALKSGVPQIENSWQNRKYSANEQDIFL